MYIQMPQAMPSLLALVLAASVGYFAGSGGGDGSRDPLFLNCEAADRAQRDMFVNGFTKLLLENGGVRTGVRHGSEGAEGGAATQELVQAFKVSCARSAARVLCT